MIERIKYKRHEQHTYGKASFMAAITFYVIATIGGGLFLIASNNDGLPGLANFKKHLTFEAFTSFGDEPLIGALAILVIVFLMAASTIQIFGTKRIERITKRHTIPLLILFQILIGVALGLAMLILKTPYIFAIPVATGTQSLLRGVVGTSTIDQKEYKPYIFGETLFVVASFALLISLFVSNEGFTLPGLITLLSSLVFNLLFNIYKYSEITKEPEGQMLDFHTKKYKLLVEIGLSFRLSSDGLSTIGNRTIFYKRHR